MAGALEAIAENGFKLINSAANPDKAYGMKALSLYLKSTITLEDSASRFDSLTWTRPILFDEVFPSTAENSQFSATAEVVNRPLLWPFIAISGGLISIFADPKSTVQATELAVRAMIKLTNFGIQHSHSQPLLCDVLSAVIITEIMFLLLLVYCFLLFLDWLGFSIDWWWSCINWTDGKIW